MLGETATTHPSKCFKHHSSVLLQLDFLSILIVTFYYSDDFYYPYQLFGEKTMTKERRSKREGKKKPAMTPKEKKAAKRSKKEPKDFLGDDKTR